jgi:hypothetical protein
MIGMNEYLGRQYKGKFAPIVSGTYVYPKKINAGESGD